MPQGEATQQVTPESEMAKFVSETFTDGVVSDGAQTAEETAALAKDSEGTEEEAKEAATEDQDETESVDDTDASALAEAAKPAATEPPKKPKQTAEQRIAELTRGRHAAERQAQAEREGRIAAEARAAALQQGLTPKEQPATDPNKAPQPDQFEYGELDTKYITALARHEAKQAYKAEVEEANKVRQAEAAQQQAAEEGKKKVALVKAGAEKYEDFNDVVLNPDNEWHMPDVVGKLITGSDYGADIAYHLASNPEESLQVSGKPPLEQAAYFGRLEAKFSSATTAAKPEKIPAKTSKAPSPPANQARGAGGKFTASADTSDFAAFEAMVRQRE